MRKPMLCHDTQGQLGAVPCHWIMEPKLDGWRWITETIEDGVRSWGGRNGKEHTGYAPRIDQVLAALPPGTVLDGENLPMHGGHSTSVSTLVANGGDGLCFVVFDVLAVQGHDVTDKPWRERREILEHMAALYFDDHLVRLSRVEPVSHAKFQEWLEVGCEGAVCKDPEGTYREGKRSRQWLKVKPQSTTDAIVEGYEMGKGKSNRAMCGALIVRLVETGVETTCAYHCYPAEAHRMVGRRVELLHHGFMPSGKVRHPIFNRTREDLEG